MQLKTKELLEAWAKKAGFWKHATKEMFMQGNTPNMKIIDLAEDPPWIGISASAGQRIEAENSGIASIQDYKEIILKLYNKSETDIKKPSEEVADNHKSENTPQEVGLSSPPVLNKSSVIPAPSDGESHVGEKLPFICSKCTMSISAEQRAATVKAMGRALCEACIHKAAEEIAVKMKPKLEPKAPEPKPEPVKETKKKSTAKQKETPAPKQHQIQSVEEGVSVCLQCGKPYNEWIPGETCPGEPIQRAMCQGGCGYELSHVRALEYQVCEGCAEKRRAEREGIKMNEKPESKEIVPVGKGANVPAVKSDHEQDMEIEKAKAKRYLEQQGGSYKVNGNEVPDSARIQNIANDTGVSVQILESEQNNDYARVRVRGNLGNQYVDGEVWVDFKTETQLLMMEFINKNQGILDRFDGLNPVLKEGAQIKNYDGSFSDAKYALVHAMLTLRKFAVRTAATKASKIVQMKLLNKEFREKEEIADEQKEVDMVEEKKKRRR